MRFVLEILCENALLNDPANPIKRDAEVARILRSTATKLMHKGYDFENDEVKLLDDNGNAVGTAGYKED